MRQFVFYRDASRSNRETRQQFSSPRTDLVFESDVHLRRTGAFLPRRKLTSSKRKQIARLHWLAPLQANARCRQRLCHNKVAAVESTAERPRARPNEKLRRTFLFETTSRPCRRREDRRRAL